MDTIFGKFLSTLYTILNYSLVGTLVIYCKTSAIINTTYNYCYGNSKIFQAFIKHLRHFYKCFVAFVNNHKVEPFGNQWINTTILLDDHTHDRAISYIETYDSIDTDNEIIENVNYICDNMIYLGSNILEYLVIVKSDDQYYYYVKKPTVELETNATSKASFLCISYNHQNMKRPIFIELNKNEMIVNNEILSATFIKRYLEYQQEKYVFDMNYTLKIIDNNVNEIVLISNQYIVLNEKDYTVITRA